VKYLITLVKQALSAEAGSPSRRPQAAECQSLPSSSADGGSESIHRL